MAGAQPIVDSALKDTQIDKPHFTWISNVSGKEARLLFSIICLLKSHRFVRVATSIEFTQVEKPEDIRTALVRQITEPVQWMACVQRAIDLGCRNFIEIGPRSTLTRMMNKIDVAVCGR
jgi:malonyl CoA-acyl carrier protein transacylase